MRRPRGPGGRFLTADEVAAMDKATGGEMGDLNTNSTPVSKGNSATPSSQKRKSIFGEDTPAKKLKGGNHPVRRPSTEDSEEPEDEDDADDDG